VEIPTGHPVAEARRKTKKRKGQIQMSELFVEENAPSRAGLPEKHGTVPREDGDDEEEDQDGASESSGAED